MGKKLIIFLIVLLAIIIGGLITLLVLCLNGTIDIHNFRINFGGRKSENLAYSQTYDIETVNTINIKQDAGDIIFENCEENSIKVVKPNGYEIDFEGDYLNGKKTGKTLPPAGGESV